MTLLAYLLAALIGLCLGLLGAGGSILTVPTFVYVLGFPAKQAIAMSLPVVGATSLFGALGHWRTGNVRVRTALLFGGISFAGSYTSASLARFVVGELQIALLAAVMLVAATMMLRGAGRADGGIPDARGRGARHPTWHVALAAGAAGVLTGLVGIGGGFIFVPALVLLARLDMRAAVGTSSLVIALNSLGGFLGYRTHVDVQWRFVLVFTAVAIGGILAGTQVVPRVPQAVLRRAFAIFLLLVGSWMLYDRGTTLLRERAGVAAAPAVPHPS